MTAATITPEHVAKLAALRPGMLALTRTYLTGDYWTAVGVLREHVAAERDALTVLAGAAAGMLREACGGDKEAALAIVDRWLSGALDEAAGLADSRSAA